MCIVASQRQRKTRTQEIEEHFADQDPCSDKVSLLVTVGIVFGVGTVRERAPVDWSC